MHTIIKTAVVHPLFTLRQAFEVISPPSTQMLQRTLPCSNPAMMSFSTIVFFFLLTSAHMIQALHQPFNISKILPGHQSRLFSINTTSPISAAFRRNDSLQQLLQPSFDLIEASAKAIFRRRQERHKDACNLDARSNFGNRIINRAKSLQLGEIDRSCLSSIEIDDASRHGELPPRFFETGKEILQNGRRALTSAAFTLSLPRSDNWTDPNGPFEMVYEGNIRLGRQTCSMEALRAYRKNSQWYIQATMTNHRQTRFMPDGERHTIREWVPQSYNTSLQMVQHNFYNSSHLELSTTILATWAGFATVLTPLSFDDASISHWTISQAYSRNEVSVDLASDSITASNIAILALPMAMTIIPAAVLTDLNTVGLISYVVLTDLISAIPFLVKGIELIQSSAPRSPAVSASYGGNEEFGEMLVFAVECTGNSQFRSKGIAFVIAAVTAMVIGVVLEIWSHFHMTRRKAKCDNIEFVSGPFGDVYLQPESSLGRYGHELDNQREYLRQSEWWEKELVHFYSSRGTPHTSDSSYDRKKGGY